MVSAWACADEHSMLPDITLLPSSGNSDCSLPFSNPHPCLCALLRSTVLVSATHIIAGVLCILVLPAHCHERKHCCCRPPQTSHVKQAKRDYDLVGP